MSLKFDGDNTYCCLDKGIVLAKGGGIVLAKGGYLVTWQEKWNFVTEGILGLCGSMWVHGP